MDRPPHLVIDLNEAPSPPPGDTPPAQAPSPPREFAPPVQASPPPPLPLAPPPPPPPPPPQQQLPPLLPTQQQVARLQQEAVEVVLRVHRPLELRNTPFGPIGNVPAGLLPGLGLPLPLLPLQPPAPHPGEAGWGNPPPPCSSCGLPEIPGGTLVCDACDRGFHPSCVRVWPPLLPPPPPPGPPGARRPRPAANEDWICPACERRGARSTRWKLGPVQLDINAAPPEDPVAVVANEISRQSITDGPQLTVANLPHFEGVHFQNTTLYDGMQFMPALDLAQCFGMRQNFTSMDRDSNADGNVPQRSVPLRRRRDLPQASTLPKAAENHELGSAGISMDPSFCNNTTEQSPSENRSSLKPPKFLMESSNHQPHHHRVALPVQYSDFFITNLGEIDNRTSYHNSHQIWPVGFTSYWHDRVTGSLFECEVRDGGNFGPLFKIRRLPCSAFQLPDASTTVRPNVVRKADTIETKEGSGSIEDTANDADDNISMLLSDFSEPNQDFLSCLGNDMEGKESLGCSNVQTSNMTVPPVLSDPGSFSCAPTNDANMYDKIGDFSYEGTTPSSVWRMIYCAMMEACEKMYKEHGHLVLFCTHSSEKCSFDYESGPQRTDGSFNLLAKFCSSNGPKTPRFIEKENDVQSTCALLKEWLYPDRIGFDLEFVQEFVESLPKSRACSNYQFLCNRTGINSLLTISSGALVAVNKNSPMHGDVLSYGRNGFVVSGPNDHALPSSSKIRELPPGNPTSRKLSPELAGDVFQILEFLGRFAEIIGLKELPSIEQVEDELIDPWPINSIQNDIQNYRDHTPPMNSPANVSTPYSNGESGITTIEEMVYVSIPVETSSAQEAAQNKLAAQTLGRCSGLVLPEIHLALLKVLFTELVSRVAIFVDPRIDLKESKSRRGRKRDTDTLTRELKIDMLTANNLTWPELARRYILAVSSMSGCMDLSDISNREGVKLFRCLQGDGGILCGALPGVAGMEKDASLLAEAETLICNSSANEGNKVFMMDYKDTDIVDSPEEPASDTTLSDWVKSLEPVRKLPTNVGTRIRKCVNEALEKEPPEWARKILEHSISKEVYKGNASGPTKKAVLSVLAEACRTKVPKNTEKPRKEGNIISISEAILKRCRIALRRAISSDESKQFANLLGTTLTNSNENEDEGILGFPGMVSRPLDFRTIDIRLAKGAYCGSWEAFHDDVKEVIRNLQTAFGDRPEVLVMVVALSDSFESLYKSEVQDLVEKFDKYLSNENGNSEIHQELQDALTAANNKLPKAPWEDGVCKVCGIDRDDESVLLCDNCDSEYHTYCLNPPLARIPLGNWYCPSCLSGQKRIDFDHTTHVSMQEQKKCLGEEAHVFIEKINKLAVAMDEKEYWELSVAERIYLLKFLCDELHNTALIREHLDQCSDKSNDLQQKLRHLNYELKELKYRVEIKTSYATQSRWMKNDQVSNNSGLVENQQRAMPTASEHLEEAEQVNVGANLNNLSEGVPAGLLNVDKPCSTDNGISSTSVIEGNKPLGLPTQSSEIVTDRTGHDSIGEGSRNEKSLGGKSGTCDNLNVGEAHSATVLNAPSGDLPDENARTSSQDNIEASTSKLVDQDADTNESNNLLERISQLQDSISTVESQLSMTSLRRECLGRDSVGRLYWVTGRPSKRPRLVADGSMLIPKDRDISMVTSHSQSSFDRGWNSASLAMYESDEEIKCLFDWLRDIDPREKDLKDSILHWQKSLYHQASFPITDPPVSKFLKSEALMELPSTKAFIVLEQKYGLQLDQDTSELSKRRGRKSKSGSEERVYRCDCLEPIWPSRHHCLNCHETYLTLTEYEGHNGGKCNTSNNCPNESKENDEPKLKGAKSDVKEKDPVDHNGSIEPSKSGKLDSCPYDFDEICRKFTTNDSNKETVKEIGLLGSNGIPSFVPSPAYFLDPPALLNGNKSNDDKPNDWTSSLEQCQAMSAKMSGHEGSQVGQDFSGNAGDEQMPKSKKPVRDSTSAKEAPASTDKPTKLLTVNGSLVPESSLMPVIGRNFHILKQLKINLLDIEAALPEEAFRASKSQQIRRRSWRAFVKDAELISYVVLAINFLQSMIKAEFLKKEWWYWSSFTAAIKTTTVSSLALRIYTLDDCIMYTKDPASNPEPADNARSGNKGKRKKDVDS